MLSKKDQELRKLQAELATLDNILSSNVLSSPATRVQFYNGEDGLKQMFWNQTKTRGGETLVILYENIQTKTGEAFFERWVEKRNEQGGKTRGIIGDHFISSQQKWYAKYSNERLAQWEARYIRPETFAITFSTIMYADVVSYFNWQDGEIFGIEIHNPEIAKAQRQLFELLWRQAEPVDDLVGVK